jgi:hypothetical protein
MTQWIENRYMLLVLRLHRHGPSQPSGLERAIREPTAWRARLRSDTEIHSGRRRLHEVTKLAAFPLC